MFSFSKIKKYTLICKSHLLVQSIINNIDLNSIKNFDVIFECLHFFLFNFYVMKLSNRIKPDFYNSIHRIFAMNEKSIDKKKVLSRRG